MLLLTISQSTLSSYLPFRLYADSKGGAGTAELANRYSLSLDEAQQRLEAARFCFEQQVTIERMVVKKAA